MESYRVQRNLVTKLKRISIKRFFLDSSANTTTPGDFWKRVKPLLPSSGQDNSDGTCIMDRGAVVSDPSNLFNEHFSSPVLDRAVLTKSVEDFEHHPGVTSISSCNVNLGFSFQPVSTEYIGKLLTGLKTNKSCGPDNITPMILKLSASEWKLSNVTPVYKKDDSSLVENYRPISILSSIPKILEKVMYDQLYDTFKTHFSLNMSGFFSGHLCCTALLKMVD